MELGYGSPSRLIQARQADTRSWLEAAQPVSPPHRQPCRDAGARNTVTHPCWTEEQEIQDTDGASCSLAHPQILLPGLSVTTSFKTNKKETEKTRNQEKTHFHVTHWPLRMSNSTTPVCEHMRPHTHTSPTEQKLPSPCMSPQLAFSTSHRPRPVYDSEMTADSPHGDQQFPVVLWAARGTQR